MLVCGERRTKSGIAHAKSGVRIYRGEGGKGGVVGGLSHRGGGGMMVGTTGVACCHRGSSLVPLAKIGMMMN